MSRPAYKTYSVRVQEGLPEKLRVVTGVPFSTLIRHIATIYLQREMAAMQKAQRTDRLSEAQAELTDIIETTDLSEITLDDEDVKPKES